MKKNRKGEGNRLIFLLGPTAVGKTDWALRWAEECSGAVVNGDSVQLYEGLNIGSAKPDFQKHPDIPHYLFGVVKAPEVWTAGDFRKNALKTLHKILPKQSAFVAGGSGFYLQALEKGMYPVHTVSESVLQGLKKDSEGEGPDFLYEELKKKDPELADQIHSRDHYRIFRALAVIRSEGRPLSEIKRGFSPSASPWPSCKVGLRISREELVKRVESRTREMLQRGLIEETESLLKKGLEGWRPLQSVGYRETVLFLKGQLDREELFAQIVQSTLTLARKQKKWFQRDKEILWYDFKSDPLKVYGEIRKRFK